MTKADAGVTKAADPVPMDPNTVIELNIVDQANAGRNPSTRWGRTQFDAAGNATIKVPLKDVASVHGLRWLSVEDQEKYLGLSQDVQVVATTSEVAELRAQLDACKGACARLAMRNAELEANTDQISMKFQTEYAAYKTEVAAYRTNIDEQLRSMQEEIMQRDARIEVLTTEANTLQEQVATLREAPTQPIPAAKPADTSKKSGK